VLNANQSFGSSATVFLNVIISARASCAAVAAEEAAHGCEQTGGAIRFEVYHFTGDPFNMPKPAGLVCLSVLSVASCLLCVLWACFGFSVGLHDSMGNPRNLDLWHRIWVYTLALAPFLVPISSYLCRHPPEAREPEFQLTITLFLLKVFKAIMHNWFDTHAYLAGWLALPGSRVS